MRAFQGIVPTSGQVPVLVGTSYDVVAKVYERLDDIMRMGLILDRTADFLFFHFDVPWESVNQTRFTGEDSYGRQLKIMDLPMVYVNGVRVPQEELTVLVDGTVLDLANAVAPGDQVHVAAFGFNADGTIYFHPMLAHERLLDILNDVETLRDQMVGHVGTTTALVDAHRGEIDAFNALIATDINHIDGKALEVEDIFARSQGMWINAGFEQGSDAVKGTPYGWQSGAATPLLIETVAGRVANVPTNSPTKSTRAFGSAASNLGPWWYISKLFKVSGGDRITTNYRYWSVGFLTNPGANALNVDFLDTNDTFVEVVSFDVNGLELETFRTKSLSHMVWVGTGVKPLDQAWLTTNFLPVLLHADAAFAEVRLVFASGSGAASGKNAYRTSAVGSHRGLVDDVNFYSASGRSLIEISPDLLGTAINARTAVINSQTSAGYATAAGEAAVVATQQGILAQTSAATAGVIQTQVAQALEDAESASASASQQTVLAAQANFEASERARGNLIGKATFEDSSLGSWAPQGSASLVPSVVPELHPRGRTVAMEHGGGVAHYASMSDDGWFHEDLMGRRFTLETWAYNASDAAIEIGVEAVHAGTGVSTFVFHSMEGGLTYDWVKLDERLPAFTVPTSKWRPALRVSGTGTAYWSDLVYTDTTSLAAVEGAAEAVAVRLVEVQAYASETEEYALASSLDALAAETSRSNAEIQAGMSAISANDAQNASTSAQNFLNMTAQVSASGASIINDVFLGSGSWAAYLTGGAAISVPNQKYLTGKTWTLTTTGSGNIGITLSDASFTGVKNSSSVVIEVEFEMISGTLNGLAAQMLWSNSGAIGNTVTALFTSDSKLHNTPGVLQKARLILNRPAGITTANFTGHTLRIVANGAAPLGAKSVKLHLVTVRPTTSEELDTLKLRADITNIFNVRADLMTGTALASLLTQLNVSSTTGLSAWITSTSAALVTTDASLATLTTNLNATTIVANNAAAAAATANATTTTHAAQIATLQSANTTQDAAISTLGANLTATTTTATNAAAAANNAAVLAGSKGKTIIQDAQPSVADRLAQNLWIDTTNNANTPKRWNGTAWVPVSDKVATDAAAALSAAQLTITTHAAQISSLQTAMTTQTSAVASIQTDLAATTTVATNAQTAAANAANLAGSKGKTLVQNTAPDVTDRLSQNLWIDTTGGANTPKRWNGSAWVSVSDKIAVDAAAAVALANSQLVTQSAQISALQTATTNHESATAALGTNLTATTTTAANAAAAATAAANLAGSKGKTIIQDAAPAATDQLSQNLWIDTTGGANTPKRWSGTAWVTVSDKIATDAAAAVALANTALTSQAAQISSLQSASTSQAGAVATMQTSLTATTTTATNAATAAAAAATLAGSKGKTIVQSAAPDVADRLAQNLWIDTTANANTPKRWNGSAWVAVSDKIATDAAAAAATANAGLATQAAQISTLQGASTSQAGSIATLQTNLSATTATVEVTSSDAIFRDTFDSNLSDWQVLDGAGEVVAVTSTNGIGGKILRLGNNSGNDTCFLAHKHLIPFDPTKTYKTTVRMRTGAGATGRGAYAGFLGVAADGVTLVNTAGANSLGSQYYHAVVASVPPAAWFDYVGYTNGRAATGVGSVGTVANPSEVHTSVAYLRPVIQVHGGQAGITEVAHFTVVDAVAADLAAKVETQQVALTTATTAIAGLQTSLTAEITRSSLQADDPILAQGLSRWSNTYVGAPEAIGTAANNLTTQPSTDSVVGGLDIVSSAQSNVYSKKIYQIRPDRTYRIKARVKRVSGSTGLLYLGHVCLNAAGSVAVGTNGGHKYSAASGLNATAFPVGNFTEFTATITGIGAGVTNFNTGTEAVRLVAWLSSGQTTVGATVMALSYFGIEDITEVAQVSAALTTLQGTTASADAALASSITTLNASIGTVNATLTQQASSISMLNGFVSSSYVLGLTAGGAEAGLSIMVADGLGGLSAPVSSIKIRADQVTIQGDLFVTPGVINHNYDMLDSAPFSSPNGASFLIQATTNAKLGKKYLHINPNAATVEVWGSTKDTEWLSVSPSTEYLVSATTFTSGGNLAKSSVYIEYGSVSGTGVVTPIEGSRVLVSQSGLGMVTTAVASTSPATAKRARFVTVREAGSAGNTGVAAAGAFSIEKKIGASLTVDGIFAVTGMAAFGGVLQSNNFIAGSAGWYMNANGSAEFNDLVVRGDMIVDDAVSRRAVSRKTVGGVLSSTWTVISDEMPITFAPYVLVGGLPKNPVMITLSSEFGVDASSPDGRLMVILQTKNADGSWTDVPTNFAQIDLYFYSFEAGKTVTRTVVELDYTGQIPAGTPTIYRAVAKLSGVAPWPSTGMSMYRPVVLIEQVNK